MSSTCNLERLVKENFDRLLVIHQVFVLHGINNSKMKVTAYAVLALLY